MQYKWHVFDVWRDIKNVAFAVTAVPAVMDFHLFGHGKRHGKSLLEKTGHPVEEEKALHCKLKE